MRCCMFVRYLEPYLIYVWWFINSTCVLPWGFALRGSPGFGFPVFGFPGFPVNLGSYVSCGVGIIRNFRVFCLWIVCVGGDFRGCLLLVSGWEAGVFGFLLGFVLGLFCLIVFVAFLFRFADDVLLVSWLLV